MSFPAASGFEWIEGSDPQRHGVARRHPQFVRFAYQRNFAVKRRQAAFLLGQEALLQQLADDALNRLRQTAPAFAATGLTGCEVCHKAAALPGAADQDIHLPPGQAKRLRCGIGSLMTDYFKHRQRRDDLGPAAGMLPCLVGQCSHPVLGDSCV